MARFARKNRLISCAIILILSLKFADSQYYADEKPCGVLYSETNYNGQQFAINDQEHSVDLLEDHHVSESGWNATLSLKIESGCSLEYFDESYFGGESEVLDSGLYPELANGTNVASVKCKCVKECKCSDIYMKKSSCARAYLEGGCSTCQSLYTDIKGEVDYLPPLFSDNVHALRLRSGCNLTVYSEQDFEGDEDFIDSEIVEEYTGKITSYKCECNDEEFVPRTPPPRPDSYPPLLDVPGSLDGVITLLSNESFSDHPGLRAALKSLKNRRSSKNAYIMLLGATGAGKSSAINLLFDSPITEIGGIDSTTTNIHEFRVPIPVDELGVANSELRVIDTPGFGDTRGIGQDAKMLATLDHYLSTHEELKDRIPNVVLVFDRFTNNRFGGEGSTFVKMLRGYDSFRERITDENFSNVIFVFSHFYSEASKTRRQPQKKLADFKRVIADYSLFPKPIHMSVAENKAKEQDLPMVNGYFQLPNNEYYPHNLFKKMDLVTEKGGDLMGMGIIRTAFRDSEDFNITHVTTKLLDENGPKVQEFLKILSNAVIGVEETPISKIMDVVWEQQVDPNLRKKFPFSLYYLQKALNIRNIHTQDDIPRTSAAILELLTVLKHDEATRILLEKGLSIKPPVFQQNVIAGYSYNVFKDQYLPMSPFQLGNLHQSDIGFMIPRILTCKLEPGDKEDYMVFDDMQQYLQHRLRSLGIDGNISAENFSGAIKSGHNIMGMSIKDDSCSLSASREFRLFEFILNDRLDLSPEFKKTVEGLPPFNESDHEIVSRWKQFFNDYGTHVVRSVYGGGSIEITVQSDKACDKELGQALFNVVKFAEDFTLMVGTQNKTLLQEGIPHSLRFFGGDLAHSTGDLTQLSVEEASKLLASWKKSLKLNPTLLTTEMKLMPISQIVRHLGGRDRGEQYKMEIDRATSLLFNSDLKYVPPPKNNLASMGTPGLAREDTPYLKEMVKMQQESSKMMQDMMMKMQKMLLDSENRRMELESKRLEYQKQRDKENDEKERRREEERKLELTERQLQQELLDQERRINEEKKKEEQRLLDEQRQRELDAANIRIKDLINAMTTTTPKPSGGCVKAGTKILMADWTEKRVETLKVGDVILDKDLEPTNVLGVTYEFLLKQKFYGFDKGNYFFTGNHIFVGPVDTHHNNDELKLYAQSKKILYNENPLMEYLNVSNMGSEVKLFNLERSVEEMQSSIVVGKTLNVFEEPEQHPMDTKMFDIQVDSPTGTYFANGYVCRHEIPPVEYWPNTMSILFRLMNTPTFEKIAGLEYTLSTVSRLEEISKSVARNVDTMVNYLDENKEKIISEQVSEPLSSYPLMMTLGDINVEEQISNMFSNPSVTTAGTKLYARIGPIVSKFLDGENGLVLGNVKIAFLQHELFEMMNDELERLVIYNGRGRV